MRNLSTEFKKQQNSGNRNYLKYADFTFTNGSALSITNEDLWSNGFKFEDAVSQSGSFDIGAAIVNKLTLQINNFSGKFSDYIWDGARVVCYIGMELSTGIEKIRICTMTVTDAPYQSTTIINLTCEDYMRKFDREYSESNLAYPATRLQIVQDACEVCGVTLQSTRFDNDDFIIQDRPDDSSITFRQVIAWVAQMGCQWAKCDEYGRLCFGWYEREVPDNFYDLVETPWKDVEGNDILDTTGEQIITIMQTGITAIQTNGFTPWLYDLEITGIKVTEYVENSSQNEAKTYQSGKTGYVIEISDNKLIQEGSGEKICQIIADRCVGLKFRPFTTGALTNIAWEAGDTIAISDRNGKQYKSFLTSVTLNPGAFEQLECSAKSVSRNKQKQYTLSQQVQAESKKNLKDERTAREKAIEELSQRLSESSGTYTTVETQPDGSNIYYLHNKPQLSDSDIIWKMTAEAWAVSTDGGQHWNGGMTVDGDVIARILTATGINADWINTGTIKAIDKDGNTTFLVDVTTGRVVINADSIQIKGKDVNAIAKEKAETEVNNFISNTYTTDINNLQSQIDGKIETWYQPNDPSLKWTKTEEYPWCDIDGNKILDESGNEIVLVWESEKAEHEGDLWHNTSDNTQWIYKSGIWQPQSIPDELLDKIDGKSSVYMVQPKPPYYEGDLWVTTNSEGKASLKTSTVNRIDGDFNSSDWIDFKYADKDDIKNAIDNYDTSLGQNEVFNKLTKGGTEQGIYIEDGKVYINAKYILAGLLAGERINGRGLKVIDDNKNVTLEIDSKGNVILAPKTFSLQGKTVKEIADSSASTAVSGQTQADIFNKLTNGGKAQGIYLDENGNVYVNGEYVQAKGIRVVDSNGKTTFAIDKTTGAVTIAASSFALGDKSIASIASEEAQKKIDALPSDTDNLVNGYLLTESDVETYWDSYGTINHSVLNPNGKYEEALAITANGSDCYLSAKRSSNPVIRLPGTYQVSVWLKASANMKIKVSLNRVLRDVDVTTSWKKYEFSQTVTTIASSYQLFTVGGFGSFTSGTLGIYRPEVTVAVSSEHILNLLTDNGAKQGIYMYNNQLYVNGQYIKALSIAANALAANSVTTDKLDAKAVTAEKMSVQELAAIGATIGGYTIQNNRIYNDKNGFLQISIGNEYNAPSMFVRNSAGEYIKYSASGIVSSFATSLNLTPHNTTTTDGFTDGSKHYLGRTQFYSEVNISGDFKVSGTKSIIAETENYGEQLFYCYETPTPTLGDFGGGVIGKDGIAIISIDDIFQESTETAIEYYVFLQNEGEGQSWVSEKADTYFVVKGTPGLRFAWELKAKQKNKEFIRFNAGKEDREVNFRLNDIENEMFSEREKLISEMEGELL